MFASVFINFNNSANSYLGKHYCTTFGIFPICISYCPVFSLSIALISHSFQSLAVREFLCLDEPPGPFDSLEESRVSATEEYFFTVEETILIAQ